MKRWILLTAAALATLALLLARDRDPEARELPAPSTGDSTGVELVASRGGAVDLTYAVDVMNDLAAFGRGDRLVFVDVSDPASPRELAAVETGGTLRDVKLAGQLAYAAADSGGLSMIDISDRTSPVVLHTVTFDEPVFGVDVAGRMVFAAARSQGLRILDASAGDSLREIGFIVLPDEAVDVVVRGEYAYVAAWYESMRVVDVSDPASPEDVSFVAYDSYDNGAAWSVSVDGDLGLAAVPEVGLRTADISNPRDVKRHRVYRGLLAPASAVGRGTTAFVADQEAGLRVLDVADPAAPFEIGSLDLPGSALGIQLGGDHAYIAAREAGLRIVDISLPHNPQEVSFVDADEDVYYVGAVADTMLAIGTENGVELLSLSDIDRTLDYIPGPGDRFLIHEDRFLIGIGDTDIRVTDLAERGSLHGLMAPMAGHGPPDAARATLVAAGQRGIVAVDPQSGRTAVAYRAERPDVDRRSEQALLRSPLAAWDIVIDGRHAFAAFDDGIRVLDVASTEAPTLLALHSTPQRVYRLLRKGDLLLAACDDGLRVLDVSNPASPSEQSFHRTPSFATSLAADGSRVYVGDLAGKISIFDAPEDADFRRVGVVDAADRIYALAITRRGLAVAAGKSGLRIISLSGGENRPL